MPRQKWVSLEEEGFPDYSVSDWGLIRNDKYSRILAQTKTNSGLMKTALVGVDGHRYTVEVSRLVAAKFLPGADENNNSLIHLDGNKEHTFVENLAWRPRWFSLQYHKQFTSDEYWLDVPIINVTTGEVFEDSRAAVVKWGILAKHIVADLVNQKGFFPHYHIYQLFEE